MSADLFVTLFTMRIVPATCSSRRQRRIAPPRSVLRCPVWIVAAWLTTDTCWLSAIWLADTNWQSWLTVFSLKLINDKLFDRVVLLYDWNFIRSFFIYVTNWIEAEAVHTPECSRGNSNLIAVLLAMSSKRWINIMKLSSTNKLFGKYSIFSSVMFTLF